MPAHLALVTGNPGKRALNLDLGVQPHVEIPRCPSHLNDFAKAEWKRITPQLEILGLVSKIDSAMLAMYCQAYGRWIHAELQIRELEKTSPGNGYMQKAQSGYQQISHWLIIANKAMEQTHRFACEFGLSPSARSRVTASANQSETLTLPGIDDAPKKPTLAMFSPK